MVVLVLFLILPLSLTQPPGEEDENGAGTVPLPEPPDEEGPPIEEAKFRAQIGPW